MIRPEDDDDDDVTPFFLESSDSVTSNPPLLVVVLVLTLLFLFSTLVDTKRMGIFIPPAVVEFVAMVFWRVSGFVSFSCVQYNNATAV